MAALGATMPVEADPGCQACAVAYARGESAELTVVAKVTLRLVHGGLAKLVAPEPIETEERVDATGGLRTAGDLAPPRPKAELLVIGRARPSDATHGPVRARLGYWRGEAILIDKSHAVASLGGGPALVRGFGPIGAGAPERTRWLAGGSPPTRAGALVTLPPTIDPRYFQSAPLDQQLDDIRSGDGLLLDQMVEGVARMATRLPELELHANLRGPGLPANGVDLRLEPDSLTVDLDRGTASVVFRASWALSSPPEEYRARVRMVGAESSELFDDADVVGLDDEEEGDDLDLGATLVRNPVAPEPARAARRAASRAARSQLERTASVDPNELAQLRALAVTPFDAPTNAATARRRQAAGDRSNLATTAMLPSEDLGALRQSASELGKTAYVDPRELEALRAAPATPFAPSPVDEEPAPPSPRDASSARRGESLGRTASVDPRELERLRRAQALPFDSKKETRPAVGATERGERTDRSRPTGVTLEARPMSSGAARSALSATAAVDPAELERLRASVATPFDRPRVEPPSAPSPTDLLPMPPPVVAPLATPAMAAKMPSAPPPDGRPSSDRASTPPPPPLVSPSVQPPAPISSASPAGFGATFLDALAAIDRS